MRRRLYNPGTPWVHLRQISKNRMSMRTFLTFLLVFIVLTCFSKAEVASQGQSDAAHRLVESEAGADMGAKLNDCIAHLPAAGGICDAVGLQGTQSAAATISCNKKNVAIWLGSVTLKLNGSPGINLSANNCALIGQTPGSSVLLINSATADAIALNASFVRVEHLAIAVPAGIA